jgi:hypothetical protein
MLLTVPDNVHLLQAEFPNDYGLPKQYKKITSGESHKKVYEIMSVCMTWDVCLVKTKVRQQFLKF